MNVFVIKYNNKLVSKQTSMAGYPLNNSVSNLYTHCVPAQFNVFDKQFQTDNVL